MGDNYNGLYKRLSDTLYVHTDSTKNKVLKYRGNGWSGCTGSATYIDPECFPGKRWAFISDLSSPVIGNVNIWAKKGDSSGYTPCNNYNILFIVKGIIQISIAFSPIIDITSYSIAFKRSCCECISCFQQWANWLATGCARNSSVFRSRLRKEGSGNLP